MTRQFMILAQFIIFILGCRSSGRKSSSSSCRSSCAAAAFPHRSTVLRVAGGVELQTAFLSPPVAMAAFYLKGVSRRT